MRRVVLGLVLLALASSPADAAYDACGRLTEAERESRLKRDSHTNWEWETIFGQLDNGTLTLRATGSLDALGASVEIYGPPGSEAAAAALSGLLGPMDRALRETESSLPHPGSTARYSPPPTLKILLGDLDSGINQAIADCNRGDCTFVVLRNFWRTVPPIELQFTAAHELYHVAQMLIWPDVYQCESFWWVEGTAEWFANRAVPGQSYSQHFLDRFDRESADSSLLGFHYAAVGFWFWAAEEYSDFYPMHMGVWGNDGLDDPASVAESLPPEAWHDFLETYLGGRLRYPDGRPAIPEPNLGEQVPEPWVLEGPPMSFPRLRMQHRAGEWQLKVKAFGSSLVSYQDEDTWFRLNLATGRDHGFTHHADCPPEETIMAAVGVDGADLRVVTQIESGEPDPDCRCLEPIPENHCMVGTWQAESTDAPQRRNAIVMLPSRWTGQDMGVNLFTFNADGTFSQRNERESVSDFRHEMDGETMEQTVKIMTASYGRWSVIDSIEMEICKESFLGSMISTVRIGGREQTTGPTPLPTDEETAGSWRYRYVCRGDTADVTLMMGDREVVSWRAKRVESPPAVAGPH